MINPSRLAVRENHLRPIEYVGSHKEHSVHAIRIASYVEHTEFLDRAFVLPLMTASRFVDHPMSAASELTQRLFRERSCPDLHRPNGASWVQSGLSLQRTKTQSARKEKRGSRNIGTNEFLQILETIQDSKSTSGSCISCGQHWQEWDNVHIATKAVTRCMLYKREVMKLLCLATTGASSRLHSEDQFLRPPPSPTQTLCCEAKILTARQEENSTGPTGSLLGTCPKPKGR